MSERARVIVFFDGDCLFCSKGLRLLHELDPHNRLRFASLQGKTARPFTDILPELGEGDESMATMIIDAGQTKVSTHSTAIVKALRATGGLGGFLGFLLSLIPTFIRDYLYRLIAKHRHHFFGKGDVCEIMRPDLRGKLLG